MTHQRTPTVQAQTINTALPGSRRAARNGVQFFHVTFFLKRERAGRSSATRKGPCRPENVMCKGWDYVPGGISPSRQEHDVWLGCLVINDLNGSAGPAT
jgi:hypothetical protein